MRFNLMNFRKKKKLSQRKMSELLGISRSYYSEIETGKKTPSVELAYKIEEVFGVDNGLELLKKE